MNKCNTVDLYESLEFCKGKTVTPGIRPEIFAISKRRIVKFPALPEIDSENATMASIATYAGDFVLEADAVFFKIDALRPKSSLRSESQGDYPNITNLNTGTFYYAGLNAEAAGFCRMANADDLIYIVRQPDGAYRVLGNEQWETTTKVSQESGSTATDAAGTTIEASVTDCCPAPYYVGKLPTAAGTIDCSTGEITTSDD